MRLDEIQCSKDLRSIVFGSLFYEVFDSDSKDALVLQIISKLQPGFEMRAAKHRDKAIKYSIVREYLEIIQQTSKKPELPNFNSLKYAMQPEVVHDEVLQFTQNSKSSIEKIRDDATNYQEYNRLLKTNLSLGNRGIEQYYEIERARAGLFEKSSYDFEHITSVLLEEYCLCQNDNLASFFVRNGGVIYSDYFSELETSATREARELLDKDRVLKGLFLLPLLDTDQDLIIFFGEKYHATFSDVDANTGLMYSAEFFDSKSPLVDDFLLNFSEDEKDALKKKIANDCRKRKQQEEERRKNEEYVEAEKNITSGRYDQAQRAFEKLGDYRDSISRAKQAEKEHRKESYYAAKRNLESGNFIEAQRAFLELGDYRDAKTGANEASKLLKQKQDEDRKKREELEHQKAIEKRRREREAREEAARVRRERVAAQRRAQEQQELAAQKRAEEQRRYEQEAREQAEKEAAEQQKRETEAAFEAKKRKRNGTILVVSIVVGLLALYVFLPIARNVQVSNEFAERAKQVESDAGINLDNFGGFSWQVLAVEGDRALIITDDVIQMQPYNNTNEDVTWETSSIRAYLNNDFYRSFSDEERGLIAETTLINANSSEFGTAGGSDTQDRVFLLSIDEAKEYFINKWNRVAEYNGSDSEWWLRSPGCYNNLAAKVSTDGSIYEYGFNVDNSSYGIRPALWLNLDLPSS